MTSFPYNIQGFSPADVGEAEILGMHRLTNRMREETLPGEPPRSLDYTRQMMAHIPPIVQVYFYLVRPNDSDDVVGMGVAQYLKDMEANQHLLQVEVSVDPDHRQRGIGRALLRKLVEFARTHNKTLLMTGTDSLALAGEIFAARLGAKMGLRAEINQLLLADLNHELMRSWVQAGEAHADDYEMMFWEGHVPDDHLDAYVKIKKVMNSAPTDDLDVEDMEWTPELVRQLAATNAARGFTKWMMVVRERAIGQIAGYTEAYFNPERPDVMSQDDTAVDPIYRGKGLGKWLKAAMVLKALAEKPGVDKVRTGNAGSNAPMLKINHTMGFRLFKENKIWQITVEDVEKYLVA